MQTASFRSWLIWLTASLFYLYEFIHRVAIGVMVPELAESFNASISALGSLSACYFFAYASAQIPVGLLIDRFGTRELLTSACLLIACSSFIFAYTSNIWIANFCRLFIGFGSAFAFVGCLKLASIWFPATRFAFIIGLTNLFGVFGAIIGGAPIAHSVDVFGWRYVMYGSGIIGIAVSVLLWCIIADSNTKIVKHDLKHNMREFILCLLAVIKSKQIWLIAAFGGFIVAPITTYAELWGVPYIIDTYQLNRTEAAKIVMLIFVGIALGGPVIGFISDKLRQRKLPMLVGALGALLCIALILFWKNIPLAILTTLHFLFGFCSSSMLLCFSLASETATQNIRATTIAFTNSIIMIMGAFLQVISSALLDYSYVNYTIGLAPILICYFLAIICFKHICETKCKFTD